jgi:ubiquitin carboxyl-terminal hydrolase L3
LISLAAAVQGAGGLAAGQADVRHHYVCFVHHGGRLYELDGLEDAPLSYGPTLADQLLHDAAAIIRAKYTDNNPDGTFALIALTSADA